MKFIRDWYRCFLVFFEKRRGLMMILIVVLFFGIGFGAAYFWGSNKEKELPRSRQTHSGGYSFINPLLDCETVAEEAYPGEYRAMRSVMEELVDEKKGLDNIEHISLYFRDLNKGEFFGFDEKETFTPASLLKVPLMIAVLKKSEKDPAFLDRKLVFREADYPGIITENIEPSVNLKNGESYTVEQTTETMIRYSSNRAANLLLMNMDPKEMDKIYFQLGLTVPDPEKPENFMTVREYASFFRVLYNATYLNKEMSEKALKILSFSEYSNGLKKNLPAGTVVAHKFGERKINGTDLNQLHDCGIVYYPGDPYLLCVMTRGHSFQDQAQVTAEISDLLWKEYDQIKRR